MPREDVHTQKGYPGYDDTAVEGEPIEWKVETLVREQVHGEHRKDKEGEREGGDGAEERPRPQGKFLHRPLHDEASLFFIAPKRFPAGNVQRWLGKEHLATRKVYTLSFEK